MYKLSKNIVSGTVGVMAVLLLAGCTPNVSPNTYNTFEVGANARVEPAIVVTSRPVTIDNKSGMGGVVGAGAGAVAGSAIGGGSRMPILGAIGGAVAGGLIGNAVDKKVGKTQGFEYILRLRKNNSMISVVQQKDLQLVPGEAVFVLYGKEIRIVPDPRSANQIARAPKPAVKHKNVKRSEKKIIIEHKATKAEPGFGR